jgi:hypothetical protein
MATYYIDETIPQASGPSTTAGMDSILQSLDRMQASRQRGRYYDYLNDLQKQKLGAAKAKDREDAHDQRDLNRETERLFEGQRNQLIDARISLENDNKDGYLDQLDKAIGFAKYPNLSQDDLQELRDRQNEENIEGEVYHPPWTVTSPLDTPSQRLAKYQKVIEDIRKDPNIVPGSAATQQLQRLEALYNYSNAAVNLATSTETLLKKPNKNIKAFINEDGVMDYQFYPSRGQIKFFKNHYNEHPFKGTRIEPGSADAADAATYGQGRAEAPSSLPGGPLIGQEGYVTDVGPSGQEQGAPPPLDSFEGVGGLLPRPGQEAISPPVDEQGRPIHLQAERENLERWQEDPRRDITSDEYITPIPSYASGPDVAPVEESRGFSPAALADAIDAVMAREESQPADLEAALVTPEQGVPQENPYLRGIVDRNAFDLVDEPRPAVEGNRLMRLDQLEPPVDWDATPFPSPAAPAQPQPAPEQVSEWTGRPVRDYTFEDWVRQNPDYRPPVATSEDRLMRRGTSPRRPMIDRSFPEMGPLPDITPAPRQQEPTELNTFGGPAYIMRLLEAPLTRRDGSVPTRGEVLGRLGLADEDVPSALEDLEALDYEPYPGNPLYMPGGPLYEEEE